MEQRPFGPSSRPTGSGELEPAILRSGNHGEPEGGDGAEDRLGTLAKHNFMHSEPLVFI